ncbi:MAG: hypothetical protein AB7Q16_18065 [Vicinamibacterales bacterium]
MRLPLSRITALVALCAAMSTVVVLSAPRAGSGNRERDRIVRLTRGGLQRFDAADTLGHDFEDMESVAADAADAPLATDQLSVHAPPGAAAMLSAGPIVGPPGDFALLPHQASPSLVLARPPHPHRGRAPPHTL